MKYLYWGLGCFTFILLMTGFFIFPSNNSEDFNYNVTVHFFYGEGCPHCANEKPYLEQWEKKYPGVEVIMYETYYNQDNNILFQQMANKHNIQIQGVPTTFIGERNWVGFSTSMLSDMENYLINCLKNGC
jgi:thiol-disulfide isomerase/thioredoxin